ncbi:spore coat protein, partial [Microvirga sp. 3-52]|nr:spore coat protein [Microvirga sp. 3-52]
MSLKKKLAMSIATGALAVSMIGGGTYAYFNDVEVNQSTFAAGTLDINIEGNDADNAIINVDNLKPGD